MGRTGKWLRSLFSTSGSKKPSPVKSKKKFAAGEDSSANNPYAETQLDANKHAIAVAAATAAVAEAALAAAQAAAEVVRLTSGGGGGSGRNEPVAYVSGDRRRVVAAVKIQSAFRAYLARRALKALKGLVKLQALVRGHIVRKQSADMLRRMQAMARIQARASAHRSYITEPTNKFNYSRHPAPQGITNRRNYDEYSNYAKQGAYIHKRYNPRLQSNGNESSQQTSNWLHHWMDQYTLNNRHEDERTDKILEIDTWKPRQPARQTEGTTIPTHQYFSWNEAARLSAKLQKPNPSVSSEEVSSALSSKCPPEGDQGAVRTAENSPRVQSATSRQSRGTFTPTKSECSRSYFGDYLSHPSYMANTASSRAKVRSQSAPKQRMQLEELGMNHGLWEPDTNSETGFSLQGNYRNNTIYLHYPGQLRRQATPTRGTYAGLSSTYGHGI